jgi:hypothetical protein
MASRSFVLQRAKPALAGLIDGSLSTLAPIFAFSTGFARSFASVTQAGAPIVAVSTALGAIA